jgi:hypothetical protein
MYDNGTKGGVLSYLCRDPAPPRYNFGASRGLPRTGRPVRLTALMKARHIGGGVHAMAQERAALE